MNSRWSREVRLRGPRPESVLEGDAVRVTDDPKAQRVADAFLGLPGIAGTEEGQGPAGSFSPTRWRF
jgi:hypothetical protein